MKKIGMKRRIFSFMTALAVIFSIIPSTHLAANAENDDEWLQVQDIVGKYNGQWTAPPTNVVTSNMTSGPILGNGDIGVVMGGNEDSQTYYISKSDFWAMTDNDNNDGTPKAIGGINIKNISGSDGDIAYSVKQDILNAEITADMRFGGTPIHSTAWVAPNSNELVIELASADDRTAIHAQAELWSKDDNANYPTSAGTDANTVWITRDTPTRERGTGRSAVAACVIGGEDISAQTDAKSKSSVSFTIPAGKSVYIVASIDGGKDNSSCLENVRGSIANMDKSIVESLRSELRNWWKDYWLKEYVVLNDRVLEEYYYGSLYQMGAASRAGKVAPGLFGHWTTTDSPAWGGDYTLDYNYYGPFNGMASSNRLEQFGSYFQPILDFIDEGRERAKAVKSVHGKSYPDGLPGVKYPTHIGPWGMETYFDCGMKSHAVFAAIPFCWYYNYTKDVDFLRDTAYPYLIEVANFWDEFLQKDENGRYVVYDSSARESWSGSNDINPVLDIAFVRNLYKNIIPMSTVLGVDSDRREKWQDILENLSSIPTMEYNGRTVFKEAENREEIATEGLGDNPVNLQGIFPGDNVGLGSDKELLETALNSIDTMNSWNQGNAFANIFVIGARVGWPAQDLMNKMKSRISSIRQPNLTYQSDGHGIEGAGALEAINSMLMQSNEGILRFFPVWPQSKDASFTRMRAVGAFLVSADLKSGVTQPVTIYSEKGMDCTVENPWYGKTLVVTANGQEIETVCEEDTYTFATDAGTAYTLSPKEGLPDPVAPEESEKPIPEEKIATMPAPDLGYWKLDDNGSIAKDSSREGNDAAVYGAAPTDGKLLGAMHFDGAGNYILVNDYKKPTTFATYSAWVKADSLTNWGTILKNWGEQTTGQIQLGLESDSGRLSVHVTQANGDEVMCSEASALPTGEWQHVAVTMDGSRIRLYRNGVETASTGYNGSLKTSFAPLGIGVKPNDKGTGSAGLSASPGWWNGEIDDVRIYSKALSPEEIGILASFERYRNILSEDFEAASVLNTIEGCREGWSIGGSTEQRVLQRGNNLGISSNAIRFGAGDTWGQNMWLSFDIQENMLSRLLAEDIDYDTASEYVLNEMSDNIRISFSAYFSCGDEDNRGASYIIKLKDSEYVPFAAIKVTPSRSGENTKLSLIALDKDKTSNKEYVILTGDSNVMNRVINFTVDINKADNTYKLNINGQDMETDNGVWIPASDSESIGSANPHSIGNIGIKQIDFVVENSGWWHVVTIDNLKVSCIDESRVVDAAITDMKLYDNSDTLQTDASFVNTCNRDTMFTAIYALYDRNGRLVGVNARDINLNVSDALEQSVDISYDSAPSTVKLYMWNSMDGMCPLQQEYPIKSVE